MDNTYNPKIRLDIDTSKALKNIQKVNEEAQKTIATLEEKKELTIEEKTTLQKLQAVERESENLKTVLESIKKIDLNLNVQPILKAIEQCEHAIRDLNTATQTGADTIDRNMSKAAKEMSNEFSAVLKDLKSDILQFFSNFSHTPDTQGLDELVKKLDEVKKKIEQINKSTIKVQVMNEGFDEMVEKANNHLNYLNRQLKYTASQFRKTKSDAGYLKSDVAATAEDMDLVARRSAQTNVQVNRGTKNMTNFGKKVKEAEKSMKKTQEHTVKLSDFLLKSFYSLRGVASAFEQAQNFAYNMWQYVASMGRSLVSTVVPALKEITSSAFEMESAFETARISYQLFFPNENPDDIISEIKRRAIANPAFDSSDLTNYVSQFAPLAEGDSKLALDAVEGIAAMLEASGQEVSTYMQRLVTNTMQIVSTGKATARDWNEFLRATPVFETVIAEVTPELRKKLGDESAEVTKSDVSQLLHALQIVRNDSSISGVPERYAQTYAGLKQQLQETIQTTTNSIINSTGFYKSVKNWLEQTDGFAEMMEQFLTPLYRAATKLMSKVKIEDVSALIEEIFEALSDVVKFAIETLKEVTGETDVRKVISKVITFVRDMLKGFINGVKDVINFMKWMEKTFNIGNLGSIVGWLASPAGRGLTQIFSALSGLVQSMANIGSLLSKFKGLQNATTGLMGIVNSLAPTTALKDFAKITELDKIQFINPTGILNSIKNSALFSKLKTGLKSVLQGAIISLLGSAVNDTIYALTGKVSAFGTFTEIASGGIGGMVAGAGLGSMFGPIGTALGAAIGGTLNSILSAIQAGNKMRERIQSQVESLKSELQTEQAKVIKNNLPAITTGIQDLVNEQLKRNGMDAIDWGSDAGAYATSQLQKYFQETAPDKWNTADAMKKALEAYNYQSLRNTLNDYTETEDFRNIGGTAFDLATDKQLRDELAKVLAAAQLNGSADNYAYYVGDTGKLNSENIVKDYLNGQTMTKEQIRALIDYYNELEGNNQSADEQFATNIEDLNLTIIESTRDIVAGMSKWTPALQEAQQAFKNAYDELNKITGKITANDHEYKLSLNGKSVVDVTENKKSSSAKTPAILFNNPLTSGSTLQLDGSLIPQNKYFGGLIKGARRVRPIYKASGGAVGVDTVPAMLQRGEFVVRKSVVDKVGLSAMNALNWGDSKLAAALMGRPSSISDNHSASYNRTSNYNDRKVNQYVQVINRNNSGAGNSYLRLGHRLALGGLI